MEKELRSTRLTDPALHDLHALLVQADRKHNADVPNRMGTTAHPVQPVHGVRLRDEDTFGEVRGIEDQSDDVGHQRGYNRGDEREYPADGMQAREFKHRSNAAERECQEEGYTPVLEEDTSAPPAMEANGTGHSPCIRAC